MKDIELLSETIKNLTACARRGLVSMLYLRSSCRSGKEFQPGGAGQSARDGRRNRCARRAVELPTSR